MEVPPGQEFYLGNLFLFSCVFCVSLSTPSLLSLTFSYILADASWGSGVGGENFIKLSYFCARCCFSNNMLKVFRLGCRFKKKKMANNAWNWEAGERNTLL